MMIKTNQRIRHFSQTELLQRVVDNDAQAMNNVLNYLSSANPSLCKIMQEAIHDFCESDIWKKLLLCLATHRWNDRMDCDRRLDPEASMRIDQSIFELFTQDDNELERDIKESVLQENLNNPDHRIRHAAACLAGMRGERQAIPILEEILEEGPKVWKLRAVKALSVLKDGQCGSPLLKALESENGIIHREARRALQNLGRLAEPVWVQALNHPDSRIRWEAARGLGEIGDPKAAIVLAEGLFDENYAVRWASGDVLARLGERAVPSILSILSNKSLNEPSRQAVYHALHGISSHRVQERIKPLLDALHSPSASITAPSIAQRMLMVWESND
jgi:HEAT repeat protein